jgi:hypothetical protein
MLDLVGRFPLKNPMEIITETSEWGIIKNPPVESKGIASFVRQFPN